MKGKIIIASLLIAGVIGSCKKSAEPVSPDALAPVPVSVDDRMKDTSLMIARELYLWYDRIPADFAARSYADPDKVMSAIRQYSLESGFHDPVDRWSFGYRQQDWDNVSSGITKDFGMDVFFLADGDLRVRSVERDGPAGRAGIQRGWRITRINGSEQITISNAGFILDNVYASNSTRFTFQKPGGSAEEITLAAATYQEHPVYLDTVYATTTGKAGYLVFHSFLGDTSAIYSAFDRAFTRFSRENIQDLIVDLRYNGGGYVSVQQVLADYIVKPSAHNNVMMREEFNTKFSRYNSTRLFRKKGTLNLNRVFFIVSKSTASASELLINNLKPYMDVKLIGPGNTYGKPVGFFPYPVGDWYVFPVSFRSTNRDGAGSYFGGLVLDGQAGDGLDRNWGDIGETCLAAAIHFINTGSFARAIPPSGIANKTTTGLITAGNQKLDRGFKGTVDPRGMR